MTPMPLRLLVAACVILLTAVVPLNLSLAAPADGSPGARRLHVVPTQFTFTGARQPAVSSTGVVCGIQGGIRIFDASGNPGAVLAGGSRPTWSPAGDKIGFTGGGIGVVTVATAQIEPVCSGTCNVNNGLAWSPLGNEFVYQDPDDGLMTAAYPGGTVAIVPCGGCEGEGPTWSPDGQWIAFEDGLEILKVPRAGGTPDTVYAGEGDPTEPAWSPDGHWIAFARSDYDPKLGESRSHIWIVDARGSSYGLYQLTSDDINDRWPAWAPDSRTVYFARGTFLQSDIWRAAFDPGLPALPTSWGRIKGTWR